MSTAQRNSELLQTTLLDALGDEGVTLRGAGMMLGVVLPTDRNIEFASLVDKAREHHRLLINVAGGNAIRLLPPLNMTTDETLDVAERLIALLKNELAV